jgi:SH3-like domain-containing protein
MKKHGWIICGIMMVATVLTARADGAPAGSAATAPAVEEKPLVVSPGNGTIKGKNVNVRGKAGFRGEVIAKLQDGNPVTVVEQVILPKTKRGEPAQWAKINFPPGAHVWVHSDYLTPESTVKPNKLNVRTGAGENYSIVGTLEKGAAVKQLSTKGKWVEIEAPAGTFAYVAAAYIQQEGNTGVPQVVTIAPETPEATPSTVEEGPLVAGSPTDMGNTNQLVEPEYTPTPDQPNAPAPPPVIEEVWVPRVVSHEGVVRATKSIQAPTKYGLHSKDNGKLINYLQSPTAQLDVARYSGKHIIVSGQEGLDERWANTPVLTIQKILVVE